MIFETQFGAMHPESYNSDAYLWTDILGISAWQKSVKQSNLID